MLKFFSSIVGFCIRSVSYMAKFFVRITKDLPVLHYFVVDITTRKAIRNDFMSHGSYVFLLVMLAMLVTHFITANFSIVYAVGFIFGIFGAFLRESYDEVTSHDWDYTDILAAFFGSFLAIIIVHILKG